MIRRVEVNGVSCIVLDTMTKDEHRPYNDSAIDIPDKEFIAGGGKNQAKGGEANG